MSLPEALEREHALRNAMNVLELSLALAKDSLSEGDAARAFDFIARAEQACMQCRALFDIPGVTSGAPKSG